MFFRYPTMLLIGAALVGTVACQSSSTPEGVDNSAGATKGEVIARVNGQPIHQETYDDYVQGNSMAQPVTDREKAIDELVTRELVYQDALRRKLDQRPEIKKALEMSRLQILLKAAVEEFIAENPATDEEIQQEYERFTGTFSVKEYKARHILLDSEEEANKIIAKLDKGADFAKLAKEFSKDGSKNRGGDLGWMSPQNLPNPVALTLSSLEPGKYSAKPVQTKFGWHALMLDEVRSANPPALEQVRPQIERMVLQGHVKSYLDQLKQKAKVEITKVEAAKTSSAPAEAPAMEAAEAKAEAPAMEAAEAKAEAEPAQSEAPKAEASTEHN